jgi:hypothetical protein
MCLVARNVLNRDAFVVRDHNGQQLAYVYFEDEPGRPVIAQPQTHTRCQPNRVGTHRQQLPTPIAVANKCRCRK